MHGRRDELWHYYNWIRRDALLAASPNLMFPSPIRFWIRHQERVDTVVSDCLSRLSWRHRARPSATLHKIQARSKEQT